MTTDYAAETAMFSGWSVTTRFHGPTDTRGSRVSATYGHGDFRVRISHSWSHSLSSEENHQGVAMKLAEQMGWRFDAVVSAHDTTTSGEKHHVFFSRT